MKMSICLQKKSKNKNDLSHYFTSFRLKSFVYEMLSLNYPTKLLLADLAHIWLQYFENPLFVIMFNVDKEKAVVRESWLAIIIYGTN